MENPQADGFDLIVTIVNRGDAGDVLSATKAAGAEGGTCIPGRGTGVHEQMKILGIPVEPAKEIVLTIVPDAITDRVVETIRTRVRLDEPGRGIGFVVSLKKVVGIAHLRRE